MTKKEKAIRIMADRLITEADAAMFLRCCFRDELQYIAFGGSSLHRATEIARRFENNGGIERLLEKLEEVFE